MARLPVVSSDNNTWGAVLNDYLSVGHTSDGHNLNVYAVYNVVTDFTADPTGATDATSAINNALTAAALASPLCIIVYLPPGIYKTTATLLLSADNVILAGSGWATILRPASGTNFDVISTRIPVSSGTAGYTVNGIVIKDLMIDCSNMSGVTAGKGNGIHLYGSRYGAVKDVYVKSCPNWAILSDGDSTNFGYDNVFDRCRFDLCAANIWTVNSEANDIIDCRFSWCGGTTAASQPAFTPQDTAGLHVRCSGGYMYIAGNVLGKGGTYTTEAIRLSNAGPCRIIGNRFDQVRYQAIIANGGNHTISNNQFGSPSSTGSVPGVQIGSSNNIITNNVWDTTAGAAHYTYCVAESGGPFANNVIADNTFVVGTSGYVSQNATSTNRISRNPPYNPVGQVTAPAFPATTVGLTNTTGLDVTAYIANGAAAITVIQIAGTGGTYVTTGMQIAANGWGSIRLAAGASVKFTYASGAPAWTWME